jgi:hypothetical protein
MRLIDIASGREQRVRETMIERCRVPWSSLEAVPLFRGFGVCWKSTEARNDRDVRIDLHSASVLDPMMYGFPDLDDKRWHPTK